jgi:hypothetical protein
MLGGAAIAAAPRRPLDEIMGGREEIPDWAAARPKRPLDEIMGETAEPSLPGATVGKGLRRGTANTLGGKADVLAMNTAEIEHARDNMALEDIWGSNSLTQVEKAALIRAAQGDGGALEDMLQGRARMEGRLRRAADAADPGEYAPRKTAAGRFGQAIVENMPYTLMGLAENAPLALLGPAGAAIGGVMSAANEAQTERADVYNELKRRGMGHEEAYRQSDPVNWQNMAALSASNIAENLLTFAGNRIMPGAGRIARIAGTLAGDALMEGAEEGVQKLVSDKALGDKTGLKELLYEAGIGAASGALFGAGGMAADRIVNGRQEPVTAAGNVTDAEADSQSQSPTEGQSTARVRQI